LETREQFLCIWDTFKEGRFDIIFCSDEKTPIFLLPYCTGPLVSLSEAWTEEQPWPTSTKRQRLWSDQKWRKNAFCSMLPDPTVWPSWLMSFLVCVTSSIHFSPIRTTFQDHHYDLVTFKYATLNCANRWTHSNFLTFHAVQILTVIVKNLILTFYSHAVFN
jgi:hypothetical protein